MAKFRTEVVAEGLCFGEGPRWRGGRLWLSDMHAGQVVTMDANGVVETVCAVPGRPSGLGWLPDGRLLVVSMLDRKVLRREADGSLATHADLSELADFQCNDMLVAPDGTAWVGNMGFDLEALLRNEAEIASTRLIRVLPDGAADRVGGDLIFPNGMVLTPDGSTLVVAETFGWRLTAFDVGDGGSLSRQRVWAAPEGIRPDGLALDVEGAVWAASPSSGGVIRISEGGEVLDEVAVETRAFACMLGGPDGRDLYIMTAPSPIAADCARDRAGRVEVTRAPAPHAGFP